MVKMNVSVMDNAQVNFENEDFYKEDIHLSLKFEGNEILLDHSNSEQFSVLSILENGESMLSLPTSEFNWFLFILVTENPYIRKGSKKGDGALFFIDIHICMDDKESSDEDIKKYDFKLTSMTNAYTFRMLKKENIYKPQYIKGHEPKELK